MESLDGSVAEQIRYINRRKQELNAIILAHFYQRPEIQEMADYVGDSLQLAVQAAKTTADVIVFCGVRFMAESAKILNPKRTVLLPEPGAGCPMADMVTAKELRRKKQELPGVQVVCYVNSSAEVKAESDICCTSSNAVKVVNSLPPGVPVLFVPDKNLGHFVARQTGREMILWEGYCPVHHRVSLDELMEAKRQHPGAVVMVHPECQPEVVAASDYALSTGGILETVGRLPDREFIIGTEEGLLYQLRKRYPDRSFYLVRDEFLCPDMKLTTVEKVVRSLETLEPKIEVPEDVRGRAYQALERMINLR
ncbi:MULTISPECIES: quinolinate synthase NadA [Syntrophothermus]|uniref:Quinolinate synthase n=1 Tax=Syntrophothermus lipocalidus (strain DSM 12680 / TGB-C1) TaxID=643648 RepID=D7CJ50_SYNLT|nr:MULTISPECIES: quinolinate synthase NadA [Syntrophothermus]ADI00939.1 quinolinate synthetase complex, A subunit [Syntrophothermus lipocalidus DSM 12680]NSW82969.1 quinolinate synthase NadA [Syntrophothermus sp.]